MVKLEPSLATKPCEAFTADDDDDDVTVQEQHPLERPGWQADPRCEGVPPDSGFCKSHVDPPKSLPCPEGPKRQTSEKRLEAACRATEGHSV